MQRHAIANHTDNDTFDDERLFLEINLDGFKVFVFGQERHDRALLSVAFDRYLIIKTRNNNLSATNLRRAVYGNQVTIEYAGIFHTHALYAQQVMRFRVK